MEHETAAYEWLSGHDIGPKFLAHVTEENRVIGFLMKRVRDCRHATVEDLAVCQGALSKLHVMGIKHGDVNTYSFLVCGEKAVMVDFESAVRTDDGAVLEAEFGGLEGQLRDESGRGGMVEEG